MILIIIKQSVIYRHTKNLIVLVLSIFLANKRKRNVLELNKYYRLNTAGHLKRMEEVMSSIESTGSYDLTLDELTFGAKTGWRNAPRCIGRIHWSKLQV